jgi:hypothetical protein
MPIPDLPVFQTLLNSLELTRQEGIDYSNEIAIPETPAEDVSSERIDAECRIWFKPVGDFTLETLIGRIQREVQSSGHKSQRNALLTLLCLFCLHPQRRSAPVQSLNDLLSRVVDGDLSQFFVLRVPPPPTFRDFAFGSFAIGKINSERISYRSKRAGSDFFERWQRALVGRMAIERDVRRVRVFDWTSVKEEHRAALFSDQASKALWNRITEAYFHYISLAHFEEFWREFIEQQEIHVAMGGPFMGDRELRLIPSFAVSIYMNIGNGWGFVAPHGGRYLTMNFGGVDTGIPETLHRLKMEFSFESYGGDELHQTIKSYARFLSTAKRHLIDQRSAEAYLHFVIALDLLFGDKDGLTRNITKRVAVLVHLKLGITFAEAVKVLMRIYDARSKYVHQGDAGGMADIKMVQTICEEVLYCLLRMQKDHSKRKLGIVNEWRATLDYFAAANETGRTLSESDLAANGIATK